MRNVDCIKTKFASMKDAEFYIKKISKESTREIIPQRAYKCNKCNSFHLTSKSNWNNESKIKKLEEEVFRLKCRNTLLERENLLLKTNNNKKIIDKNIELTNRLSKYNTQIKNLLKDKSDMMKTLIRLQLESKIKK